MTPHVALLIETSREYGRAILRGITRYQEEHAPWSIYFEPGGLGDPPPEWLARWRGDGIISRVDNQVMADTILATGIPAVDVRAALYEIDIPLVAVDKRPLSKLGFEHLRDLGIQNFAFSGTPKLENRNHDEIGECFVEFVEQEGYSCDTWLSKQPRQPGGPTWEQHQNQLAAWLESLPKPVGILTCHDERGQQVLDACRRIQLSVPDEVAVLGVDNDPYVCDLCTPKLTSIDVNPSRVGYEAAALLTRLMKNENNVERVNLLGPPRGVFTRRSTDTLVFNDQEVESATRYVRDHATEGIRVSDVIRRAKRAPSTLDRRVKQLLGHSIKAEITRVRLARAKELLSKTDFSIEKVANLCGFNERKYFCEVFRKHEGVTATQYRKRFRFE